MLGSAACPASHLFMLLHGGVEFLGQVVGHIGHTGFLLVGPADTAFILVSFLVVLFLSILAVTLAALQQYANLSDKPTLLLQVQYPAGTLSSRLWTVDMPNTELGLMKHRKQNNNCLRSSLHLDKSAHTQTLRAARSVTPEVPLGRPLPIWAVNTLLPSEETAEGQVMRTEAGPVYAAKTPMAQW